jgi:hypothetical protein
VNSTIILDCQTGAAMPYCEDCIARKTCKIHKEAKLQKAADVTMEVVELAVAVPVVLPKK